LITSAKRLLQQYLPLADIGTTAVIGHPVVMSLRWRSGSTLDLVAAYSLGRNLFDGAQHGFRSVVFQAGQDAHRIGLPCEECPRWKEQKMNKMVLFLLLAFSSALALSSANSQVGKVTRLMTKDLPDVPGKEGMIETVDFAPGEVSQPHRHNADLFVYVLEGSVITQVKGGISQTVRAGEVFYESPTDVHIVSRNASETQPAKLLVFYVKAKGTPPTVLLGEGER
jgi:quercetin dioxygenase-like cupin family protein